MSIPSTIDAQYVVPENVADAVADWSVNFSPNSDLSQISWGYWVNVSRYTKPFRGGYRSVAVNFGLVAFDEIIYQNTYSNFGFKDELRHYGSHNYGRLVLLYTNPSTITTTLYAGIGYANLLSAQEWTRTSLDGMRRAKFGRSPRTTPAMAMNLGFRARWGHLGADYQVGSWPQDGGTLYYQSLGLVYESNIEDKPFEKISPMTWATLFWVLVVAVFLSGPA